MCGILGVAAVDQRHKRGSLESGLDALAHRGPDDKGEWWSPDGRVGLGHRRLAIIDLSAGGHQPMHYDRGQLTIVFNGEIYNYLELKRELVRDGYEFHSESDTEVILAAYNKWGRDCVTRLNGMFAFAIYDSDREEVVLARDRAGEKPLFYSLGHGELVFGSELKGFICNPSFKRRLNLGAVEMYLSVGYIPGGACILQGVHKVPAAHSLTFDLNTGRSDLRRYWQLPAFRAEGIRRADAELLEEVEVLLEDSVRRQLVADVPVGVLLSGGVDSSLVTAMAARTAQRIKTFTVSFPGYSKYNESDHARLIAQHFGTEHLELEAERLSPDMLFTLARQYDEPIIDSSMIPTYLVTKLVREHCTVALGGDGGDELFGGYAQYSRLLWSQNLCAWIPSPLRRGIAACARDGLPTGFKGRNWLQVLGKDLFAEVPVIAAYFDSAERRRLLRMRAGEAFGGECELDIGRGDGTPADLLQRATRMDFQFYLPEDILVKVDRASMLNSLEMRSPMLDYRMIEFAFGQVPSRLKATSKERKILLKLLTEKVLPTGFDRKRKQGFSIPLDSWLKQGPWRELFYDILLSPNCMFDKREIEHLLKGQDKGRVNSERLFGLVVFELWRGEYHVGL